MEYKSTFSQGDFLEATGTPKPITKQHFHKKTREELTEEFRDDFIAVYSKPKAHISSLSYKKQIEIIIASMSIAYSATSNTLEELRLSRENCESILAAPNKQMGDGTWSHDLENIRKSRKEKTRE